MKFSLMRLTILLCLSAVSCTALAERPTVDPTRPPSAQTHKVKRAKVPKLRLDSIWVKQGIGSAQIDGERYSVGDTVGAWRVRDISSSGVVLTKGKERLVLTVFERGQMTISRENK